MTRSFFLILLSTVIFWQCVPDSDGNSASLLVRLECEGPEDSLSLHEVYLLVQEQKVKIAEIPTCEPFDRSSYATYQIPDTALTACGGGGAYLFVVREANTLKVFQNGTPAAIFQLNLK